MSKDSLELEAQLIETIVERRNAIITQAQEKVKIIMESAREEADKITKESEEAIISLVGPEIRAVNDRIIGSVELEGRKKLIQTRQDILSNIFNQAEERLNIMANNSESDYMALLNKMIEESILAIGGDEYIIMVNQRDYSYLKNNIKEIKNNLKNILGEGTLIIDDSTIDISGGVVIKNSDSSKIFYNTLKGRLNYVREKIEADVAKFLGVI
jgi:vacuolar-type H+-ATPase subunit E/Vma4